MDKTKHYYAQGEERDIPMNKHPYSIRLDEALDKRLQYIAGLTGRTKTSFIREAIEQYVEDMEDYADAVAALKDKGARVTLDALEHELGLDKNSKSKVDD